MAGDAVCSVALGVIADLCVVSQDSKIGIEPWAELLRLYRDCFNRNEENPSIGSAAMSSRLPDR
jgi:hypothetical protein